MVRANRVFGVRTAIGEGRTNPDGDAWQPGDGLDAPDDLGRPEYPFAMFEARREIGHAHPPAMGAGEDRLDDRRVARIFRRRLRAIGEHDIAKPLLLVARQEARESTRARRRDDFVRPSPLAPIGKFRACAGGYLIPISSIGIQYGRTASFWSRRADCIAYTHSLRRTF